MTRLGLPSPAPSASITLPVVFALDPGRTVAACWGRPGDVPKFDHWNLGVDGVRAYDLGEVADLFARHLAAILDETGAHEIVFEAPFVPRGFTDANALRLLYGQCWTIEQMGFARKLPVSEAPIGALRADVLPKGINKPQKADVRAAIKARGLRPRNQHEADAAAVWLHRVFRLDDAAFGKPGWRERYKILGKEALGQ